MRDVIPSRNINMLPCVSKPSRYLGWEQNSIHKDPSRARLKVALAFPDSYEIGMSHLGLKILYHILNSHPGIMAERAFSPWGDAEILMRQRGLPLLSHESGLPLSSFDILGKLLHGFTPESGYLRRASEPDQSVNCSTDHVVRITGTK